MTTQITMEMVKELRTITGVGMSKCKQALQECGGSVEDAIAHLRKAGMASAVKKEGREANEGAISFAEDDKAICTIEINAETDFVIKNETFQKFLKDMAEEALATRPANVEAFLAQKFSKDDSTTIDEQRSLIVQTIGENIQIRRVAIFEKTSNVSVGVYSHMGGKIMAVVEIEGSADQSAFARDIAMHVAAEAPEFLASSDVPEATIANERDIAKEQVKGKPENIIDKIVDGKLNAYFNQFCLLNQKYIKDSALTIEALIAKQSKESGSELKLKGFVRWMIGSN
ncbi:Elongation factor Ts [Chlamydiales bacterium SCGC AG-110-M15]|nr:Elongation factor Ts [Chlamydiales bacterium SCGC AG-110-M15]